MKFGWQGFGSGPVAADVEQLEAARAGVGQDVALLVDAAMAWGTQPSSAIERAPALQRLGVLFLEEPFVPDAFSAYQELRRAIRPVRLAGGEGCHSPEMAMNMINYAGLDYIQIDTGRVGGITAAKRVADAAVATGCTYLNHTFTSRLALSASLQPFAGYEDARYCEYPIAPRAVSWELTENHLERDANGLVRLPDAPGLGMRIRPEAISRYLRSVEIRFEGRQLYATPVSELGPEAAPDA